MSSPWRKEEDYIFFHELGKHTKYGIEVKEAYLSLIELDLPREATVDTSVRGSYMPENPHSAIWLSSNEISDENVTRAR